MEYQTPTTNAVAMPRADDLSALGSVDERRWALRKAWICWAAMLGLPVICLVLVMIALPVGGALAMTGWTWFFLISSVLWLAVLGPGIYVLRGHCFRAAWRGRPVEPVSYVRCMTSVWAVLEAGCLLSLCGVVASGTVLPCAIPGVIGFMLLAVAVPSGRAMGLESLGTWIGHGG